MMYILLTLVCLFFIIVSGIIIEKDMDAKLSPMVKSMFHAQMIAWTVVAAWLLSELMYNV